MNYRVIQNFTFRKFISDQAFSCSFGKWNAEKSKNFWNRTTFRWCPGPSKFYYIAPLMNYSQYSLDRNKILVYGLGKNLKKILKFLYICLKEKWRKKILGSPQGVRQTPNNGQNPYFDGVAWPPWRDLRFFFHFSFRLMYKALKVFFKFFPSP